MQVNSGGRAGGRHRSTPPEPRPAFVTRDTPNSYGGRVRMDRNAQDNGQNGGNPPNMPFMGEGFVNPSDNPGPRKKVTALFARRPNSPDGSTTPSAGKPDPDGDDKGNTNRNNPSRKRTKKQNTEKNKLRGAWQMRSRQNKDNDNNDSNGNGNGGMNYVNNTWSNGTPGASFNSASWNSTNKPSNTTIELSSNVKSGLLYNKAQDQVNQKWTNLLISNGELMPPLTVSSSGGNNNFMGDVVVNDVYYECLRVCQININRIITDYFTQPQWYGYTFAVCKGLQIYYMYDSIQAYISDPNNQNPAMLKLYNSITPEAWNNFSELRLELSKHYLKPEMLKFIMFMYQNFTYHKGEAGCIMRLSWRDTLNSFTLDEKGFETGRYIKEAIADLRQPDTLRIASYLSRGFPNWQIKQLPASVAKPIYSEDFINFWINQNSAFTSLDGSDQSKTVTSYGKIVTSKDQNSPYYLVGDDVDGLILSCNGMSLAQGKEFQQFNGMWAPWDVFNGVTDTRYANSILHWNGQHRVPLDSFEDSTQLGLIHFAVFYEGGENIPDHFVGYRQYFPFTKPVLTTSINNMAQVCNDAYRYLLYPSSAT